MDFRMPGGLFLLAPAASASQTDASDMSEPKDFFARFQRWRGTRRWRVPPVALAGLLFALMLAWVLSGLGEGNRVAPVSSLNEQEQLAVQDLFAVRTQQFLAVAHARRFSFRARTEAERTVNLPAETVGVIVDLPVEQGSFVPAGTIVCRIDKAARLAQYQEAEAMMRAKEIDFRASQSLLAKGYISRSQAAGTEAAYDAARAQLQQRRIEIARTEIAMPFDAILDEFLVEVSDFIGVGQPCARVVDKNPLLATAQLSESEVSQIVPGLRGTAQLATGEMVDGVVRYVAERPDPQTRTYRLEMEIPNPNLTLRDGITTEVTIIGADVLSHKVPQSILTLNDDGVVGVKAVVDGVVRFKPVQIIADEIDGAWVTGLSVQETLITLGQEFVVSGQKVKAVATSDAESDSDTPPPAQPAAAQPGAAQKRVPAQAPPTG